MYFSSFAKNSKLKFDQDSKACWSFCFELKVLNESKYSTPWVCCYFGNVFTSNLNWLYHFNLSDLKDAASDNLAVISTEEAEKDR